MAPLSDTEPRMCQNVADWVGSKSDQLRARFVQMYMHVRERVVIALSVHCFGVLQWQTFPNISAKDLH